MSLLAAVAERDGTRRTAAPSIAPGSDERTLPSLLSEARDALWVLLLTLLAAIPALYFSARQATNEFLYQNIALVQYSLGRPHIGEGLTKAGFNFPAMQAKFPAYNSMILGIAQVTGLPPQRIQFLPIGSFVIGIAFYGLSCQVLRGRLPAMLLTVAILFDASFMASEYSVFVYSWTYTLFLVYALVLCKTARSGRRVFPIAALGVLFIAAYSYHYTAPIWMIAFGLSVAALAGWRGGSLAHLPRRTANVQSLVISFLIFYLGFNQLIYSTFIRLATRSDALKESSFSFLSRLLSQAGHAPSQRAADLFVQPAGVYGALRDAYLGSLLLLVVAGCLWTIARHWGQRQARPEGIDWFVLLTLPSIAVTFADVAIYSDFGVVSTKYVALMFPLLAVLAVGTVFQKRRQVVYVVMAVLLSTLSVLAFVAFVRTDPRVAPDSHYSAIAPSADWLLRSAPSEPVVLSDLDTLGRYLIAGASAGNFVSPCYWTSSSYSAVIAYNPRPAEMGALRHCQFVAVDLGGLRQPLAAPGWRWYQPLGRYLPRIYKNSMLDLVYDDSTTGIFAVRPAASRFNP